MTPLYVIVHCSASEWGNLSVIDDWHAERGFQRNVDRLNAGEPAHVGYQYVIGNGVIGPRETYAKQYDGLIEQGRRETEVGAHARGYNGKSVGVCLIGDHDFTAAQMTSLYMLCATIMERWDIPVPKVLGHCEITTKKTCPNMDMDAVRSNLTRVLASIPRACGEQA